MDGTVGDKVGGRKAKTVTWQQGDSLLVLAYLTLGQLKSLVPCHLQIMLLETARRYNHETECITFLKDFTYSKDDFHRAGLWKALTWS